MRMKPENSRPGSALRGGARPTNVTLNAALVEEAKALGVNISLAATSGLKRAVAKRRAEQWIEQNAAALDQYNEFVEKNGLPLEKSRLF